MTLSPAHPDTRARRGRRACSTPADRQARRDLDDALAQARPVARPPVAQGADRAARGLRLLRARSPRAPTRCSSRCAARITPRRAARPRHRVAVRGLALPDGATRSTRRSAGAARPSRPIAAIARLPQVVVSARRARAGALARGAAAVPADACCGDSRSCRSRSAMPPPSEVAAVLDPLWGGAGDADRVSSDLSHYLRYDDAARVDRATARRDRSRSIPALDHEQACGATPDQRPARRRAQARPRPPRCSTCATPATPRATAAGRRLRAFAFFERWADACRGPTAAAGTRCSRSRAARSRGALGGAPGATPRRTWLRAARRHVRDADAGRRPARLHRHARAAPAARATTSPPTRAPPRSAIRASRRSPRRAPELARRGLAARRRRAAAVRDEADALAQLRPGEDGLVLERGRRTRDLPAAGLGAAARPARVPRELKRKAGLPARLLDRRSCQLLALPRAEMERAE